MFYLIYFTELLKSCFEKLKISFKITESSFIGINKNEHYKTYPLTFKEEYLCVDYIIQKDLLTEEISTINLSNLSRSYIDTVNNINIKHLFFKRYNINETHNTVRFHDELNDSLICEILNRKYSTDKSYLLEFLVQSENKDWVKDNHIQQIEILKESTKRLLYKYADDIIAKSNTINK